MKSSYLVQRLTRREQSTIASAFSFGGGLRNGGLSNEAMDLLPFRFDYMGSAEFEYGAVPKTLQAMAGHDLIAGVTDTEQGSVLYICDSAHEDEVIDRIAEWAESPYGSHTKEAVLLHQALAGGRYADHVIGWLELDNGFSFFIDEDVWRRTCAVFGVELLDAAS